MSMIKFLYDRIKQVFSYKIEGYDNYIKISHLYNEWALEYFDKNGAFDISKCNLIAYANGGYYSLDRKIGKFGYSVEKKKKK